MYSFANIITFILIISYSADITFGLKCYHCVDTGGNPSCKTDPKSALVQECSTGSIATYRSYFNFEGIQSDPTEMQNDNHTDWRCMTLFIKEQSGETLIRTCAPNTKGVCDQPKETVKEDHYERIKECCNTDYCNSSFKINAGLLNLSICLIIITLFWK